MGVGLGVGVGVGVGVGFLELVFGFLVGMALTSRLTQLTQPEGVPREIWSLGCAGSGVGSGVGVGFGVAFGVEETFLVEEAFGVEDFFDFVFGGAGHQGGYTGFFVDVGLAAEEVATEGPGLLLGEGTLTKDDLLGEGAGVEGPSPSQETHPEGVPREI